MASSTFLREYEGLLLVVVGVVVLGWLYAVVRLTKNACSGKVSGLNAILFPILVGGFVTVAFQVPEFLDKSINGLHDDAESFVPAESKSFHQSLLGVCDMHADTLMWNRDITLRGTHGHVDLKRLVEGNVALQAFTIVTKAPLFLNFDKNPNNTDAITVLNLLQQWSFNTVYGADSLLQRALHQCTKLHRFEERSEGTLKVIKTAKDLKQFVDERKKANNKRKVAGLLGVEGLHCLHGDVSNVKRLFDAGVRMMAPVHFFDNELGGSAHGVEKGGLTLFGRSVIDRMEQLGVVLDVAHSSEKLLADLLQIAKKPLITSHTGVRGTCPGPRNLSDEFLKAIAKNGGIVSIAFFEGAVCGRSIKHVVDAIRYTADLIGVKHVALGSDFDGAVKTPIDSSQFALITHALVKYGFKRDEVELILGGNIVRLFQELLP